MIIIIPTDTVYGISCPYLELESIKSINKIKNRDIDQPMQILCESYLTAQKIAKFDEKSSKLAKQFWPGELTLILPASDEYFKKTGFKSAGIRVPNCKQTLDLLKIYGSLSSTSVNNHREEPINEYSKLVNNFKDYCDKIIEADKPFSNLSSTVVNCLSTPYLIQREGNVSHNDILKILGTL